MRDYRENLELFQKLCTAWKEIEDVLRNEKTQGLKELEEKIFIEIRNFALGNGIRFVSNREIKNEKSDDPTNVK